MEGPGVGEGVDVVDLVVGHNLLRDGLVVDLVARFRHTFHVVDLEVCGCEGGERILR